MSTVEDWVFLFLNNENSYSCHILFQTKISCFDDVKVCFMLQVFQPIAEKFGMKFECEVKRRYDICMKMKL